MATHARSIVHRDLSPDNIILRGGEPEQAVIIDFGIAKDASAGARTIVGNDFAGKYEYAAPEQLHGRAEARSDLYALGASLLATFRGRVPDVGRQPGRGDRRASSSRSTPTGVPEPLRGLIDDLTQPDPARRPPSAAAVVAEIDGMLKPTGGGRRRRRTAAARPAALAAGAALALLLARRAASGCRGCSIRCSAVGCRSRAPTCSSPSSGADGSDARRATPRTRRARAAIARRLRRGERRAAGAGQALSLAAGAPSTGWAGGGGGADRRGGAAREWRLELERPRRAPAGVAPDAATRDAVARASPRRRAGGGASRPSARSRRGRAARRRPRCEALVAPLADCGPLELPRRRAGAMPLGRDRGGHAARREPGDRRTRSRAALGAGDRRPVAGLDVAVLNPALCTRAGAAAGGAGRRAVDRARLRRPARAEPVRRLRGRRQPGRSTCWCRPSRPRATSGSRSPTSTGNLFNLLPNIGRPEQRAGGAGRPRRATRRIRVAYSLAEAADDAAAAGLHHRRDLRQEPGHRLPHRPPALRRAAADDGVGGSLRRGARRGAAGRARCGFCRSRRSLSNSRSRRTGRGSAANLREWGIRAL